MTHLIAHIRLRWTHPRCSGYKRWLLLVPDRRCYSDCICSEACADRYFDWN